MCQPVCPWHLVPGPSHTPPSDRMCLVSGVRTFKYTSFSEYSPGIWCQDLYLHLLQTECAWYLVSGSSHTPPSDRMCLVSDVSTFKYTSFSQYIPGIWCQDLYLHLLQTKCAWYQVSGPSYTPPSVSMSLVSGVRTFNYTFFSLPAFF